MKFHHQPANRGVALILVMLVVVALGILAGGFAKSMKVETQLARNSGNDSEFEWIGRSGVEMARYILAQELTVPNEGAYDALNQKWAGGPMGTNDNLAAISLDDNVIGNGKFSIKMIDMERKFNINTTDDVALRQAMTIIGVDASEVPIVVDSIMDWRDPDSDPHLNGAENDYYNALNPPYNAKNGLIDDLSELLMVRGVTPEMYWGAAIANHPHYIPPTNPSGSRLSNKAPQTYGTGLVDLFTPISSRFVNINTASATVLQMIPGLDANTAQGIITARAGPDGVEGTDDDVPFRNVGELINVPGINSQAVTALSQTFSVRSSTFQVTVTVEIDQRKRQLVALLRRNSPTDVHVLMQYWK